MKGRISLKDFIQGVKAELIDAAETSNGPAAFELTEVELEAQFVLDVAAKAEGAFAFFVKVGAETSASQTHKVKIKMRPLKPVSTANAVPKNSVFGVEGITGAYEAIANLSPSAISQMTQLYPTKGFPYMQFDAGGIIQQTGVTSTETSVEPGRKP